MEQLIETWEIAARINLYLLDALEEAHLADAGSTKGRSVGEQFAHLHNVRLLWFKSAQPELLERQEKIDKTTALTKALLKDCLTSSAAAMTTLLQQGLEEGRIKGFKPHPAAFLGYLIAHESHHRGQIILALKHNGHMPSSKTLYGLWEWGSR